MNYFSFLMTLLLNTWTGEMNVKARPKAAGVKHDEVIPVRL